MVKQNCTDMAYRTQYDPTEQHRRSIRLKGYDYSQAGGYFITICTHDMKCVFGNVVNGEMRLNEYGKVVKNEWLQTFVIRSNVELDVFIVMPNHIHGVILLNEEVGATRRVAPTGRINGPASGSIGAIIGQFKSIVTKQINKMRNSSRFSIWQRNYYEHIIRNEKELNLIREYIINNPSQWQFDRENPEQIQDKAYDSQWCHLEEAIYGK